MDLIIGLRQLIGFAMKLDPEELPFRVILLLRKYVNQLREFEAVVSL